MGKLERDYQLELKHRIEAMLPGAIVLKNDSSLLGGIPDLSVFHGEHWAWLEVKKSAHEKTEPNQPYYVALAQKWSFGAFIYPENEKEVLDALYAYFTY